ncbi:MAG: hypothetical protein ACE5EE_08075 [Fidelibacterota bacterium]
MADEETRENQNIDAHKQFILEKMDEMVEGLGPGYGEALMEELIGRMEKTVSLFHDEVTEMLEMLKSRSEEREEKLKKLIEAEAAGEEPSPQIPDEGGVEEPSSAEKEMSEWEKRLEEKAAKAQAPSSGNQQEKDEEPKKRKGLFGKKKK